MSAKFYEPHLPTSSISLHGKLIYPKGLVVGKVQLLRLVYIDLSVLVYAGPLHQTTTTLSVYYTMCRRVASSVNAKIYIYFECKTFSTIVCREWGLVGGTPTTTTSDNSRWAHNGMGLN